MKIALRYHDNDFLNTFMGVMRTILIFYRFEKIFPFTKEQLLDMINHMSYAHYRLYQNKYRDVGHPDTHIETYLQLQITDVLIGPEVDAYILSCNSWDNSETVILDTDLDYPGSDPIYLI
jgi:hypothetical protein